MSFYLKNSVVSNYIFYGQMWNNWNLTNWMHILPSQLTILFYTLVKLKNLSFTVSTLRTVNL